MKFTCASCGFASGMGDHNEIDNGIVFNCTKCLAANVIRIATPRQMISEELLQEELKQKRLATKILAEVVEHSSKHPQLYTSSDVIVEALRHGRR